MLLFFGLRFVSAIRFASDNFSAISLIFLGGGGQMSHSHSSKKTIHFLELHVDWIKWMRRCCNQTVERDQDILLKQETSRMSLATASTCRFPTHKGWPLWLRRSESNGKSYLSELISFPTLAFAFGSSFSSSSGTCQLCKLWGRENYLLNKPYLLTVFLAPTDDIRWHTNSKTDHIYIYIIFCIIYCLIVHR